MSMGYLIGNWSRFYVVDENNRSLAKIELSGSLQDRTCKVQRIREGVPPPEVISLVQKALKTVDCVAVEDDTLARQLAKAAGSGVIALHGDVFRRLRLMFFRKGINKGHPIALATALQDKKEVDVQPDAVIRRLVDMLNIFDESHQFYGNFAETWYRNRFIDKKKKTTESNHNPMAKEELIVTDIDQLLGVLSDFQDKTRKALASICAEYAPNLCKIAGAVIAAKLIAEAGSLERLSMMPAGTIQLLGAKKAFFRALNTGSNPPKYGIVFSHPLIQNLPSRQRGKMARSLSCQIAIASRADQFTHRDIFAELQSKLKKRFHKLRMIS